MIEKPNTLYTVTVVEGSPEAVANLLNELRCSSPLLSMESAEEATRHRDWLHREIGGFCSSAPGHILSACRFETDAVGHPDQIPIRNELFNQTFRSIGHSGIAVIGHLSLDTRRIDGALAIAVCSDTNSGIVAAMGDDRRGYRQVMQHVLYNDDSSQMFQAIVEPMPYVHRIQWSDSSSPLRLDFTTEDPLRNGWTFTRNPDHCEALIVKDGVLKPEGTSINTHTRWPDAYLLHHCAEKCGVFPYIDEDAQLMVSGYGLFNAGVIDNCMQLVDRYALVQSTKFKVELTEDQWRAEYMRIYVRWLTYFVSDRTVDSRARALAYDHLQHAKTWLAETKSPGRRCD